jgi:hypothetical protein
MATQTKSEPVDGAAAKAPTSIGGASPRVVDSVGPGGDASAPASGTGSLASGQSSPGDDEDVSLDELMISDSNEDDGEPEESTDVHGAIPAGFSIDTPEPPAEAEEAEEVGAPARATIAAFADSPVENEDATGLAAAAAAQEAAAEAAAEEADARVAAARRGTDAPAATLGGAAEELPGLHGSSGASHGQPEPSGPAVSAERLTVPPAVAEALAYPPLDFVGDLEPPPSSSDEEAPMSVELEPPSVQFEAPLDAAAGEPSPGSVTVSSAAAPAVSAPQRRDAPLPSFDIPDNDGRRRRAEEKASRAAPRPLATALSHLSEVAEEDDDDAVTHIGLPVVPDAPDYTDHRAGFQVADAGVAAMRGFEPDLSLSDARRATTRVVQRFDISHLEPRRATSDTNPALSSTGVPRESVSAWLSGLLQRVRPAPERPDLLPPARRRGSWLLDTVLPPLSLVLFGSGIGAGIMLLQPDRGAKAAQAQSIQSLKESTKRPTTLSERAEAGDGDALFKVTNISPNDRNSALTLALERGYQTQKQNEFKEFSKLLEAPGGMSTPNLTTRFLNYATSPETMLAAFSHLISWPGTTGPDVLYAVWEKAPGGNRAASLAQQLLHSPDQRAKATPALITALDLRSATSCEDYLRVLPAVQRDGDQRCSATLRALKHTDGCGDDGQQDCFACLREGSLLEDALTAIEGRVPPQL